MKKKANIGFNEEFNMYMETSYKRAERVVKALEYAGFIASKEEIKGNDDEKITVVVTPFTAASAHMIMNNLK